MNPHIIEEVHPHAVRSAALSALLSCSIFFFVGFFGRDVWLYHVSNVDVRLFKCVAETPVGPLKPTLQWRLPDEPKK